MSFIAIKKIKECDSENSTFDFTEKSKMSDFVINVDGTKLYVTKSILAVASPVFDRMFESEFKENENSEMTLPGKKPEDVMEFLRCIYPNILKQITYENAYRLLPFFEEYQVFHLKARCEIALCGNLKENTSPVELNKWLGVASMYALSKLRNTCISLLVVKPYQDLIQAEHECKPSAEDRAEIFQKICAKLQDTVSKSLGDTVKSLESNNMKLSYRLQYM